MSKSLNRFSITIASVVFLGLLVAANEVAAAGQGGTPEEAKAMLERAVAALEADQPAALKAFTAGTEGSRTATCTCSAAMRPTASQPPMAPTRL